MDKNLEFYLLFVHHEKGWNANSVHFIFEDAYWSAVKVTERSMKDCEFVVCKFSVEGSFLPALKHLLDSKFSLHYKDLTSSCFDCQYWLPHNEKCGFQDLNVIYPEAGCSDFKKKDL